MSRICTLTIALTCCLILAGCEIPAQTYWSPDGARAAYLSNVGGDEARALIFDAQGKILANLGISTGGLAWSADSKRLYFASIQEPQRIRPRFDVNMSWRSPKSDAPDLGVEPNDVGEMELVVSCWEDGRVTPLFTLARLHCWHLAISPDQNWLAVVAASREDDALPRLYVYCIPANRLYPLADYAAMAVCFTGPSRLAFVEPSMKDDKPQPFGLLTEVNLDAGVDELHRSTYLAVVPEKTLWMASAGDDILFTTMPIAFPATLPSLARETFDLYRFRRADGSLRPLVQNVGPFFAPSPGGGFILLQKATEERPGEKTTIALLDLSSSALHSLCPGEAAVREGATERRGQPAFPAWRTDTELSCFDLVAEPQRNGERYCWDLGLYRLTPDFKLQPVRTLSRDWPIELKPSIRASPPVVAR